MTVASCARGRRTLFRPLCGLILANTLRSILSHPKSPTHKLERSGVVYSIPCQDCGYHYIGETGLRLSTRVKQHNDAVRKGNVPFPLPPLTLTAPLHTSTEEVLRKKGETEKSAIAEHVWTTQHTINWGNISVVYRSGQRLHPQEDQRGPTHRTTWRQIDKQRQWSGGFLCMGSPLTITCSFSCNLQCI